MAVFSPFFPLFRNDQNVFDVFDDQPFFGFRNPAFLDAVNATRTNNRANVTETDKEFRLELEVPGYQKSEITLEYGQDGRVLIVSGKTEKSYEEGPAPESVDAPKPVTVENVQEESKAEDGPKGDEKSSAVVETSKEQSVGTPAAPKYWISERTVGSFRRSFSLPPGLDLDKASASLEHGVLTVVIPKATKHSSHRITIA